MDNLGVNAIGLPLRGVIGCIHVAPLPGSPRYGGDMKAVIRGAIFEARIFNDAGVAGIIVENMHDVPYHRSFAPSETVAAMAVVSSAVRNVTNLPLGIQILAGAAVESLAVGIACDLQFLRVEGFSFAHVADEGIIQSCAATLLRKRAELKAQHIKIVTDIKKKHSSHAITADLDIAAVAEATAFMEADGLIVTGSMTGDPPCSEELRQVRKATKLPLWIGSGLTADNLINYKGLADCLVVGSTLKKDGFWKNPLDLDRIRILMERAQEFYA
jgi:membrane complex biogenesis BtpA family protein